MLPLSLSESLSGDLSLKLLIQSTPNVLLETMASDPAYLVKCTRNQPCVYNILQKISAGKLSSPVGISHYLNTEPCALLD